MSSRLWQVQDRVWGVAHYKFSLGSEHEGHRPVHAVHILPPASGLSSSVSLVSPGPSFLYLPYILPCSPPQLRLLLSLASSCTSFLAYFSAWSWQGAQDLVSGLRGEYITIGQVKVGVLAFL